MPLKLKVGKKGYIIIPKAIREAVGIEEGDEVIVEVKDGIVIRPVKKSVDRERLKELLRQHVQRLKSIEEREEPKPGEAASLSLEEEFEE